MLRHAADAAAAREPRAALRVVDTAAWPARRRVSKVLASAPAPAAKPGNPGKALAMEPLIHTMARAADLRLAEAAGAYSGSADDRRDGFLHFSTAAQLRASAAKHRTNEAGLVLLTVATAPLGPALRWEPAGQRPGLFPHLYGPLPLSAVRRAVPLPLGPDGTHAFPPDIP